MLGERDIFGIDAQILQHFKIESGGACKFDVDHGGLYGKRLFVGYDFCGAVFTITS